MKKYMILTLIFSFLFSTTVCADERVSLGYIYAPSQSHFQIVDNTNGNINVVSPTCLDINVDGHLEVNNIFDESFVISMHEKNIKVTPFFSNHWGRERARKTLEMPETVATELVEVIDRYSFDGVNIDLENLLPEDKDNLTIFIKILREKLPPEKTLSVAVAANPNRLKTTWLASYDYRELAKYSDYLVLMAYDEHSQGGAAGPVASKKFVENSIKVILEQVSRDKIVLGIPLYGRIWQDGANYGGEAVVMGQVERIAQRYNVVPVFDKEQVVPYIKINVKKGDRKAYINGKYLEEGQYKIWYENEQSILAKLELMNRYGLKGSALWALDNESSAFWEYYAKGFANEGYESEESVIINTVYARMERLEQQLKPLEIEIPNDFIMNLPQNKCLEHRRNGNYIFKEDIREIKMQLKRNRHEKIIITEAKSKDMKRFIMANAKERR